MGKREMIKSGKYISKQMCSWASHDGAAVMQHSVMLRSWQKVSSSCPRVSSNPLGAHVHVCDPGLPKLRVNNSVKTLLEVPICVYVCVCVFF